MRFGHDVKLVYWDRQIDGQANRHKAKHETADLKLKKTHLAGVNKGRKFISNMFVKLLRHDVFCMSERSGWYSLT